MTDSVIIALNDSDAEEFKFDYPNLADARWMTASLYLRMGEGAPRNVYVTPAVRELPAYQFFHAKALEQRGRS